MKSLGEPLTFEELQQCVNLHDPMGLLEIGAPEDEYTPEIAVMRAAQVGRTGTESAQSLAVFICSVFTYFFREPNADHTEFIGEGWQNFLPLAWSILEVVKAKNDTVDTQKRPTRH